MSFALYSRSTVIRKYYDDYVPKTGPTPGATLAEAATALGWFKEDGSPDTKRISDAVFYRGKGPVMFVRTGKGRWVSTDQYNEGWDAGKAKKVLEDHLSGRYRIEKLEAKTKAGTNGKGRPRSVRVARPGAEDWSHFHFWKAVLMALDELGALLKGAAKEVTYEVKPKLAEHKVQNQDRVGGALRLIANRLGWVADTGGDPNRWYLTPEYNRLTTEARDEILSQWDNKGNPIVVRGPVDLAEPEASYEEGPPVLSLLAGVPLEAEPNGHSLVGNHRYEIKGEDFGLTSRARALIEVDVPLGTTAEEQLKLARLILAVQEQLLRLV